MDSEQGTPVNFQELPPVDRGVGAWTFCAAAFVLEMMVWGFGFSYGIFQGSSASVALFSLTLTLSIFLDYYTSNPPFEKDSSVAIAAVGTVALFIQYGECVILSLFFSRYPDYLRTAMWSGLALYFVSLFASSFATQIWQLIILQGIGVGVSGGLLYIPVIKLLPEWFSERRGLAAGIIFSGCGLGGFVFPFALNALLEKVGLQWALRVWAIGTSACSGIALLGMRSRFPIPKFAPGQRRPKFVPQQVEFLKKPVFWTFVFATLMQGVSYFPVSLYIATFTRKFASQLTATIVLSLFNCSAVVGQVTLGHLTDRVPYPFVMALSTFGSGLGAFFLWGFARSATYLYFFAIVFGALSGGASSSWAHAAADCTRSKPEHNGLAFSGISFFKGTSAVIGPIVAGLLLEAGDGGSMAHGFGRFGYGAVELFVGACALVSAVGSLGVAFARQRAVLS